MNSLERISLAAATPRPNSGSEITWGKNNHYRLVFINDFYQQIIIPKNIM
jgi:hypothetical protein